MNDDLLEIKLKCNDKKSQGCRDARLASRLITSKKADTIALLKQILLKCTFLLNVNLLLRHK